MYIDRPLKCTVHISEFESLKRGANADFRVRTGVSPPTFPTRSLAAHALDPEGTGRAHGKPPASSGVTSLACTIEPPFGCHSNKDAPGAPRGPLGVDARGRRSRASELPQTAASSHVLPFSRLAAIIFFFCKIFCKQRQKSYYKKEDEEGWHYGQETHRHPVAHAADTSRCKRPFCTEIYFL